MGALGTEPHPGMILSCRWSYGVVVWEIFALGTEPYPGMTAEETMQRVVGGYRMPCPHGTPQEL